MTNLSDEAAFLRNKVVSADEQAANIILTPAATFAGELVDATGKSLANPTIHLQLRPPARGASANRTTATDEQDTFEFAAVHVGTEPRFSFRP